MHSHDTYGDIDYNDPSTYTIKYLPSPDAWPSNGPAWLFEDSTPEEIATMQQGARDEALKAASEAAEAASKAASEAGALAARQSANIEAHTPTGIDQVDPETGKRIPNGFRATSRESTRPSRPK
jgi:hypothetical protein